MSLKPFLQQTSADLQVALEALKSKTSAIEMNMETQINALRKAGRDREQDLETLNNVLRCNQDLINVRARTLTHLYWNSWC